MNLRYVTLRLNLDRDQHRRVWELIQRQHGMEGLSYTDVIVRAFIKGTEIREREARMTDEIVEQSAERIVAATEQLMRMALPAFLAGAAVQSNLPVPSVPASTSAKETLKESIKDDTIPDDEIPWDYLGE